MPVMQGKTTKTHGLECHAGGGKSRKVKFGTKHFCDSKNFTHNMSIKSPAQHLHIYGIRNCDTMKKAMAFLDAQGTAYEFVDYKKASIAAEHLPDWNARAGWQKLLNTRGLMWRKLSEEQRADIDEQKALALMIEYPALIKRPVLDTGKALLVGFDEAAYANLK